MPNPLIITEENIEKFTPTLHTPEAIEQVRTIIDDLAQSRSIGSAYRFFQKLEHCLKQTNLFPEARQIYNEFILLLKFIALPMLEDDGQRALLSKNLLFALRRGINLRDRIHFIFYPYFQGKADQPKLYLLLKAFDDNDEQLGEQRLKLGVTSTAKPLVKNWLSDYKASLGSERGGSLGIATYLTQNPNPKTLSKEDLELLKIILSTYEWLRSEAVPREFLTQDFTAPKVPAPPKSIIVRKKIPPPPPPPLRMTGITEEPKNLRTQRMVMSPPPAQTPRRSFGGPAPESPPSPPSKKETFVPRTQSVNEALYRSTLEELAKMRAEYEKKAETEKLANSRISPAKIPPASLGKQPIEPSEFSVNEALIHAGHPEPWGDHGEIVPGEKIVEEKLKKLEGKIDGSDKERDTNIRMRANDTNNSNQS